MGNGRYMLRFETGEKLKESFSKFLTKEKITSATFHGFGGFSKAQVSYFDTDKKKYMSFKKQLKGMFEVFSINGNVSLINKEMMIHMHTSFSTGKKTIVGGHVTEAVVGPTIEIYLQKFNRPLIRKMNSTVGIPLLNLNQKL
jgi:uncharacterized protein